jgi:hypothetical protein
LRTSNDAAVSIAPPIMPQGGFSPLRLEGWHFGRDLPGTFISLSLLPAYTDLRSVCRRPSCFNVDPLKVGSIDAITAPHRHAVEYSTYPRGPRSGRVYYPGHHHLIGPIRPTRGHIPISSHRLIWDASAVRERLGHPRAVPVFRCTLRPGMPSPKTPGSSNMDKFQRSHVDIGLRRVLNGSALPKSPQSASRGVSITGLPRFTHLLRPASLLAPLYGSDRSPGRRELLLPGFRRDRLVAGYDYSIDWTPMLVGFSPTGMAARLAAPELRSLASAVGTL